MIEKKQTTADVFNPHKRIIAKKGIDARAWFYNQSFNGRIEPEAESDPEPQHAAGCVCADCNDADLTARND